MNCSEAKDLIQVYMDSELDARNTLDVQRHLEMCSACARILSSLADQDAKLRSAAHKDPARSAEIHQRLIEAIRKEPVTDIRQVRTSRRLPLFVRIAAVAAAAVIIVAALWGTGLLSRGGGKVYADAVADHENHCTLGDSRGEQKDPGKIQKLTQRFFRMDAPIDLSSAGLSKPKVRICQLDGKLYLHLTYFDATKSAVPDEQGLSLFLRLSGNDKTKDLTLFQKSGLNVGSASDSGIEMVVVSPLAPDVTRKAAELALSQLPNRSAMLLLDRGHAGEVPAVSVGQALLTTCTLIH